MIGVKFFAEVNCETVGRLKEEFNQNLSKGEKQFCLYINSKGGFIQSAFQAYEFLKKLQGENINISIVNLGRVESAAIVIYCAAKRRYSIETASFMIHQITRSLNVDQISSKSDQIIKEMNIENNRVLDIISATIIMNKDQLVHHYKNEWFFSANEAQNINLSERILDIIYIPLFQLNKINDIGSFKYEIIKQPKRRF